MNSKAIPTLPTAPGVYLFKDASSAIIYIGKAKSLRTRVRSYFKTPHTDWKVEALMAEYASMDFITTKSEMEALLLEASLIRQHKPKFNVLLKTGQPFLYILVTNDALPHIKLVRSKSERGTYFGPFLHKSQTRSAYRYLIQTFKLFMCNKTIDNGCLDYHLGLCAGNCKKEFNTEDYKFKVQLAVDALKSNHAQFLKSVKAKIAEYNAELAFEKSKRMHEYLLNLDTIFTTIRTRFSLVRFEDALLQTTAPRKYAPALADQAGGELQKLLHLPKLPLVIDCFDISHFQSQSLVGSCVRFANGIPDKNKFRRFKIKTLLEQNDYAALAEIVSRRYKDPAELPDLVLIDGGRGQLNAVLPLLPNTPCISLAKREETIFSKDMPEGIKLDIQNPGAQLLIALRDYAHHFAITYHRTRQRKAFEEMS